MGHAPVSFPAEAQGVASQSANLRLQELLDGGELSESTSFVAEETSVVHQQGMLGVDGKQQGAPVRGGGGRSGADG